MQYVLNTKSGLWFEATPLLMKQKQFILCDAQMQEHIESGNVRQFTITPSPDGNGIKATPVIQVRDEAGNVLRRDPVLVEKTKEPQKEAQVIDPMSVDKDSGVIIPSAPSIANVPNAVQPAVSQELSVPDDFDVDIEIRTLAKPALLSIAGRVEGLMFSKAMPVKELRAVISSALDQLKGQSPAEPAEPAATAPAAPVTSVPPAQAAPAPVAAVPPTPAPAAPVVPPVAAPIVPPVAPVAPAAPPQAGE